MVQSVELLLDGATEESIQADRDLLRAIGIPATPHTHRPHVTLAVAAAIPGAVDSELSDQLAAPLPIRLGELHVFSGRRPVLVRLVVPSPQLAELQLAVHTLLSGCPGQPRNTSPQSWTPHVTLARRMSAAEVSAAIELLTDRADVDGFGVALRRWDGDRHREWTIARSGYTA